MHWTYQERIAILAHIQRPPAKGNQRTTGVKKEERMDLLETIRLLAAISIVVACADPAAPQDAKPENDSVKIGMIGDMSGLYRDFSGPGSLEAVRMAVEDFGGKVLGKPILIVSADHQNKPDIAVSIVRRWFDVDKVDVITDIAGSAISLAVSALGTERKKVILLTNGATTELNQKQCAPYSIQYRSDTYAVAKSTAKGLLDQGGTSWFFIAVDYALGHSLVQDTSSIVRAAGGTIAGEVKHPLNTGDFSSYILTATNSGAKVVAIANTGGDMINSLKAAAEFGLTVSSKQRLTGLLVFESGVHAVGLKTVQGLVLESDFYWDMDQRTREWSERFFKRVGMMPDMTHAANYSAVINYLKAVEATKSLDAATVVAQMKKVAIDDVYARNAFIHDLYLFKVKSPAESKRDWDDYKLLATLAGKDAFRPLADSQCPMVKH
jgi:branched-chain amino acid transport system substrate-binding protein